MAILVTSQPDYLQPVYSVQEYTLYDSANYSKTNFYYELTVTVGSESRTLKLLKDENNEAVIDVQDILKPFLEATFQNNANVLYVQTPNIIEYSVVAKSYWTNPTAPYDGSSTAATITKKVFYGVDRYDDEWDASIYEFRSDSSGLFLTSWHGDREVTLKDESRLQCLNGQSNGINSTVNGFTFTRTQINGDVSSYTADIGLLISYVTIIGINCSSSAINTSAGYEFIDASTISFTVAESDGLSETLRFNLVNPDERFDRYYRIQYIDHLGSTEAFNFTKAPENNINISSTQYVNNRNLTKFGTTVEDIYTIRTGWLDQERSKSLKDLWYSPKVAVAEDWKWLTGTPYYGYAPIVIRDTSKKIYNRHNVKGNPPINYDMTFRYSKEYDVQMI
jgi:hypothetical protein